MFMAIFEGGILRANLFLYDRYHRIACFIFFWLIYVLLAGASVSASTISVPNDIPSIQGAINASQNGDTVIVESGVYVNQFNENLTFWGKAIVVRSRNGAAATIIDCESTAQAPGRAIRFENGEDSMSVLEGFTFTGGYMDIGGAVYCSTGTSPTIRSCVFENNWADRGGGLYCYMASPRVINSTFRLNKTEGTYQQGAGVYLYRSDADFTNCLFEFNYSTHGGGVYCEES